MSLGHDKVEDWVLYERGVIVDRCSNIEVANLLMEICHHWTAFDIALSDYPLNTIDEAKAAMLAVKGYTPRIDNGYVGHSKNIRN